MITVNQNNLATRNRKTRVEFRKQQLIEATIDCIDSLGLSQTTLGRIAERAKLSQGNVVFHFQSKDALLEQTLQHLTNEYYDNWRSALDACGDDPVQSLFALIDSSFSHSVCSRKKISVWYAYWGEARSRPKYQAVCGQHDLAFSTELKRICTDISYTFRATLDAETAALAIEGMIDGLWQNQLLAAQSFDRKKAVQAVNDLVSIIYPDIVGSKS
ncbi:MAG: TetR/AcrR family bet gene transcriptional repressor [Gammaproteobacteria bacterium]|jgi:TetR/AcrR family transcriptional repressor of bet genes